MERIYIEPKNSINALKGLKLKYSSNTNLIKKRV